MIKVDITVPVNTTTILYLPEKDGAIKLGSGTYHYSYATKTNLEVDRFSMESTLGQIVAEPLAVELLEQYSPGIMSNPMIKLAYDKTIAELCNFMPAGGEQLFRSVIDALNKQKL